MDSLCRECMEKFRSWGGNPVNERECITCDNYAGRNERESEQGAKPSPVGYSPMEPQLDQIKAELLHVHDTLHQMQAKRIKKQGKYTYDS